MKVTRHEAWLKINDSKMAWMPRSNRQSFTAI